MKEILLLLLLIVHATWRRWRRGGGSRLKVQVTAVVAAMVGTIVVWRRKESLVDGVASGQGRRVQASAGAHEGIILDR